MSRGRRDPAPGLVWVSKEKRGGDGGDGWRGVNMVVEQSRAKLNTGIIDGGKEREKCCTWCRFDEVKREERRRKEVMI